MFRQFDIDYDKVTIDGVVVLKPVALVALFGRLGGTDVRFLTWIRL